MSKKRWKNILKYVFKASKDEEQEAFNLAVFILALLVLACTISFFIGTVAGDDARNVTKIANLTLVFGGISLPSIFSFAVLRARAGLTVKAISEQKRIEHNSSSPSFENSQALKHKYYLSRIAGEDGAAIPIANLALRDISKSLCEKIDKRGAAEFQIDLAKEFRKDRERRAIRCIISNLPDQEFFRSIASIATIHALNLKGSREEKKEQLEQDPQTILCRDIYVFMKAWLVCSVDNYREIAMPVSTIGLNYPSKEHPNKQVYKVAFEYIEKNILERPFALVLLKDNSSAVRKLQEKISELIDLIEEEY
ncbi:MAG: hypothetical protein AAGN15_15755 [Cyanobacteria bacterium J06581_3]